MNGLWRDGFAVYGGPSFFSDEPALVLTAAKLGEPETARLNALLRDASPTAALRAFSCAGAIDGRGFAVLESPPSEALELVARRLIETLAAPSDSQAPLENALVRRWRQDLWDWSVLAPMRHAARARGLRVRLGWLSGIPLMRFGWPPNERRALGPFFDCDSAAAREIGSDKALTRALLADLGLPAPPSLLASSLPDALTAAASLGFPVMLKHSRASNSMGVVGPLRSQTALKKAFRHLRSRFAGTFLVERFVDGGNYRCLLVDGELRRASEGRSRMIVGDGCNTIEELWRAGRRPLAEAAERDMRFRLSNLLLAQAVSPATVLASGRRVAVTPPTAQWADCLAAVHPETRRELERLSREMRPSVLGVDVICADISQPLRPGEGIIDVNSAPGTFFHAEQESLGKLLLSRLIDKAARRPHTVVFAGGEAVALARKAASLAGINTSAARPDDALFCDERRCFVALANPFQPFEFDVADMLVIDSPGPEPVLTRLIDFVADGGHIELRAGVTLSGSQGALAESRGITVREASSSAGRPAHARSQENRPNRRLRQSASES